MKWTGERTRSIPQTDSSFTNPSPSPSGLTLPGLRRISQCYVSWTGETWKGCRTVKSSVTIRQIKSISWVDMLFVCLFVFLTSHPLPLKSLPDIQILLVQETDSFLIKSLVFLLQQRELLWKLLALLLTLEVLENKYFFYFCACLQPQGLPASFQSGLQSFPITSPTRSAPLFGWWGQVCAAAHLAWVSFLIIFQGVQSLGLQLHVHLGQRRLCLMGMPQLLPQFLHLLLQELPKSTLVRQWDGDTEVTSSCATMMSKNNTVHCIWPRQLEE